MGVHPTAIVDKGAEIEPSAEIGPFVVIEGPVSVAAGVRILPHARLSGWTRIGEHCEIHMGAVVGALPQGGDLRGAPGSCEIGPHTVVREYVTIHRGAEPESRTVIGAHCLLSALCQVSHNCVIGDHVTVINGALLSAGVRVDRRAFVSGQAVLHEFCHVGELAMVGGHARVSGDLPPFLTVVARDQVIGINRVGLIRAGMTGEELAELRAAYKQLYRSGKPMSDSIGQLDRSLVTPAGHRLVAFLKADRRRPLIGPQGGPAAQVTLE